MRTSAIGEPERSCRRHWELLDAIAQAERFSVFFHAVSLTAAAQGQEPARAAIVVTEGIVRRVFQNYINLKLGPHGHDLQDGHD